MNHARPATFLAGCISMLATMSASAEPLSSVLMPTSVFGQIGLGDQRTQSYMLGATKDWHRIYRFGAGAISGYFEGAFGRWTTGDDAVRSAAWSTQFSVTPVLRFRPVGPACPWFVELGVGANYIAPLFRSGRKRFSTEFNFGDHMAIGADFGPHRRQELVLRVEHFSNAGLAHPNPGENFLHLRYAYRLQ
jgi:lipid A 3-O-deacylase